jgi:hypothetical protein
MSNLTTLISAGLIDGSTPLSQADQDVINNNLSAAEVSALISVYGKVGLSFLSRNCGSATPAPGPGHPIGIVF